MQIVVSSTRPSHFETLLSIYPQKQTLQFVGSGLGKPFLDPGLNIFPS